MAGLKFAFGPEDPGSDSSEKSFDNGMIMLRHVQFPEHAGPYLRVDTRYALPRQHGRMYSRHTPNELVQAKL